MELLIGFCVVYGFLALYATKKLGGNGCLTIVIFVIGIFLIKSCNDMNEEEKKRQEWQEEFNKEMEKSRLEREIITGKHEREIEEMIKEMKMRYKKEDAEGKKK